MNREICPECNLPIQRGESYVLKDSGTCHLQCFDAAKEEAWLKANGKEIPQDY